MASFYYVGLRLLTHCRVLAVDDAGKVTSLRTSRRSRAFPTDQWEWGYAGAGPADLAWALAMDCCQSLDTADAVFQGLKWRVVSMLTRDTWVLTRAQVQESIDEIGQAQCAAQEVLDLDLHDQPPHNEHHDTHTHP